MHQLTLWPMPAARREHDIALIHQATGIYTRVPEIEALLDRLGWPGRGTRLLDPGAGNGGFLVAALGRLDLVRDDVGAAAWRVRGFEFYPGAVTDARSAVCDHLLGRGWSMAAARRAAELIVEEHDFLLDQCPVGEWDVIAANPPYWRIANLPPGYRADYELLVPAHARADLLYAYLHRAAAIAPRGGQIGLITADRWLLNAGSAELRRGLDGLVMEHLAVSLNHRQGLNAGRRLVDLLAATPGQEQTLALFYAQLEASPWSVYEVQRAITEDRKGKPHYTRNVQTLMTGARSEAQSALAALGVTRAEDGIPRVWLRERDPHRLPTADWCYVAAPVGADDKKGPGFDEAWEVALTGPSIAQPSLI